jgi:hypothetical protein
MHSILCDGACFWKEVHFCFLQGPARALECTDHFRPDKGVVENLLNEPQTASCVVGLGLTTLYCTCGHSGMTVNIEIDVKDQCLG